MREQLPPQGYQDEHLWALPLPPATATAELSTPAADGDAALPKQISSEKTAEA